FGIVVELQGFPFPTRVGMNRQLYISEFQERPVPRVGMNRVHQCLPERQLPVFHTRGDEPLGPRAKKTEGARSPHARGDEPMPGTVTCSTAHRSHTRGDEPIWPIISVAKEVRSPHAWG